MTLENFKKPEYDPDLDPVTYYNKHKIDHAKDITEAEFKDGYFNVDGKLLTPFQVLSKFKFKGNHYGAWAYVSRNFLNAHIPYIRVGTDYYKIINPPDRHGVEREELKTWKRATLIDDYGKAIIKQIPNFDSFINKPSNTDYQPVIGSHYNLYRPFTHAPKKGDWKWTKILMEHVFGDQYELGLKYMQMLYQYPDRYAPIPVLVSKERSTGKTTFLNWLNSIFGDNCVVINPTDLGSSFNSSYAHANIICIEETEDERRSIVTRIKALSASKYINLNRKFVDNSKIPFFGHFIITSNEPERFLKIDPEEIRFWVRKLEKPKFKNTNIDDDLMNEIPAFLHYLTTLPELDWSKSRMLFDSEELRNTELDAVINESRSGLYKDLELHFESHFAEHPDNEYRFRAEDIKERFYRNNSQYGISYIHRVLLEEFKFSNETRSYLPYNATNKVTKRCFEIQRNDWIDYESGVNIDDSPF